MAEKTINFAIPPNSGITTTSTEQLKLIFPKMNQSNGFIDTGLNNVTGNTSVYSWRDDTYSGINNFDGHPEHPTWFSYGSSAHGAQNFTVWLSDEKLKNSIKSSEESALEKINRIEHKDFKWNDDFFYPIKCGYIAQELQKIIPEAIFVPKNPEEYYQIDTDVLIPYITKALQELKEKVDKREKILLQMEAEIC